MKNGRIINRRGLTLIELMVTVLTAWIVLFGIGVYIVDMQRGYGKMYGRVHGGFVRDAYVARKAFDGLARKATRYYTIGALGDTVELDYWQEYTGGLPIDCHAKLFVDDQSQFRGAHGARRERGVPGRSCGRRSECDCGPHR